MALITSCKKDKPVNTNNEQASIVVPANTLYSYNLGIFGREDNGAVLTGPMHAQESFFARDSATSQYQYRYRPVANYRGTDKVVMELRTGSIGNGTYTSVKTLTLDIVVQ